MLEMPRLRHDVVGHPVAFGRIVDQLLDQMAQVPLDDHAPDIENDCVHFAGF